MSYRARNFKLLNWVKSLLKIGSRDPRHLAKNTTLKNLDFKIYDHIHSIRQIHFKYILKYLVKNFIYLPAIYF